nr:SJCHGC09412 protein [Schistosoma japonicum]
MLCRRKFYEAHPSYHSRSLSPEKRGDITLNTYVLQEEDRLSVELRYWNQNEHKFDDCSSKTSSQIDSINTMLAAFPPTFLLCPPELTVGHIEKLIRMKFNLKPSEHDVSVFFSVDDLFNSDHTLSDLACLYAWRRQQPFKLYFTIKETPKHTLSTVMEFQPPSTASSQTHNVIEKSERCTQGNNNTFCSVKSKLKNLPTSSLRKRHVNNSDDELEITPVEVSTSNSQVSSKSSCKISLPTQFIKSISLSSSMLNTSNSVCSSLA